MNLPSYKNLYILFSLCLLYMVFDDDALEWILVDCASSPSNKGTVRNRGKKQQLAASNHEFGLYFCVVAFILCVIPSIGYFFYNVYKDPVTPVLIKRIFTLVKEKSFGFLSREEAKEN